MDKKQHILNEIKRTAEMNGAKPLGKGRFEEATGIKELDWYGKSWNDWNGWGDALKEAGYVANRFGEEAYQPDELIQNLITLIKKLGHFPVKVELKREVTRNVNFPVETTFRRHLGSKKQMVQAVHIFCSKAPNEYQDVLDICEKLLLSPISDENESLNKEEEVFGFVYLMKSGKHYKIGCTNALDRRQYEIGIQLPEKIQPVHSIRTDDPSGIEAYWHNRFKGKRLNGEWFSLNASEIKIFKKRKFM